MKTKLLISFLTLSFFALPFSAYSETPDLSPDELQKAREIALSLKPPVDFDKMLKEAERLGVECSGDLTRKIIIATCDNKVKIAQSEERTQASEERTRELIKKASEMADEKLKQINNN